ncbi:MAG TPA: NAD-dependent epimerase/dehydratase family protein [Mucilaginibacter sp.]|nr:NAD-dependent epimerase/dehydratase family protein [Mucilaginibacter sp.]
MKAEKILVTGASGQIGTELVTALSDRYGFKNVIATDINGRKSVEKDRPFYSLDVLNAEALDWMVETMGITQIYHLAAVLSASGEKNPVGSWDLNMRGLLNVLEAARKFKVEKLFWPSSIAVFGSASPKASCPQNGLTDPSTVYGISKVAGESWCKYYHEKFGLDIRSIRYPGLISHTARGGGGTTDYAIDIFHEALEKGSYTCFLKSSAGLPMLYMPDAIRATMELMEAPRLSLSVKTAYNLSGLNFTPYELANTIAKHIKQFKMAYEPDFRQEIAESWPWSIDDHQARFDWGWSPAYDLEGMVKDMLMNLNKKEQASA